MKQLLMRVRKAAKNDPQFQIPRRLHGEYFAAGEVVSTHNGQSHRCVHTLLGGVRLHTIKLEVPEIKAFSEPIIRFAKDDAGKISYTAFDGTAGVGLDLYNLLRSGIESRKTHTSIRRIDSATWWSWAETEASEPERLEEKHVVLFGDRFAHDPTLTQAKADRREELKLLNNRQVDDSVGYVYIISHPYHTGQKGYLSIGKTWNYEARMGSYNRADPDCEYRLEYVKKFANRHKAERRVHALLSSVRKRRTEWFKVSLDDAIKQLEIVMAA